MSRGDTPDFSKDSLCTNCQFAHIVEGPQFKNRITFCRFGSGDDKTISFKVTKCNRYRDENALDIYEMKRIAHIIEHSKSGKIGFMSPADLRKRNGEQASPYDDDELTLDPIVRKVN